MFLRPIDGHALGFTHRIDYHGGERYAHLERVTGKPDRMEALTKPLVPVAAAKK